MKVTSLLILFTVVGGGAYVLGFHRDWVSRQIDEGRSLAAGYTAADSPAEAMQQFHKAITARDYRNAARYCTKDYAEQLTRAHDAAGRIADLVDRLTNIAKGKYETQKSMLLLESLDPFPTTFKYHSVIHKEGQDKATGRFVGDGYVPRRVDLSREVTKLDFGVMLTNVLHPGSVLLQVPLKQEGEGDSKQWKLHIPVSAAFKQRLTFFLDRHQKYATNLRELRDEALRERRTDFFEPELIRALEISAK